MAYFNGDENAESKVHRLGIADSTNTLFIAYNEAVERFRQEADAEILANEAYLATLKQVELGEMKSIIYVED